MPLLELYEGAPPPVRDRWRSAWVVSDRREGPVHPLVYPHPETGLPTMLFHLGMTEAVLWGSGGDGPDSASGGEDARVERRGCSLTALDRRRAAGWRGKRGGENGGQPLSVVCCCVFPPICGAGPRWRRMRGASWGSCIPKSQARGAAHHRSPAANPGRAARLSPSCQRPATLPFSLRRGTPGERMRPLVYDHRWQQGDLILSDNLAVAHEADPDTQVLAYFVCCFSAPQLRFDCASLLWASHLVSYETHFFSIGFAIFYLLSRSLIGGRWGFGCCTG